MIETPHQTHSQNFAPEETLREPVSSLSVELARISAEIQSINSGFQSQLQHALADTQTAFETQYAEKYQRAIGVLREQLEQELRADFQSQLQHAVADTQAAFETQYAEKYQRAIGELREQLQQQFRADFQSQLQHAVADTQAAFETQYAEKYQRAIGELREQLAKDLRAELQREFDAELQKRLARSAEVKVEFERAGAQFESLSKEIEEMLDDPTAELSKIMRKKAEQAELKSYVEGLRYCIGG